ncbi:MAG TPA: thioesterase family protein [Nocardia sp.]|uniref:thioesterase family protein n=1 Tax=Nocardia sp. TaxID=1821 RepID=UPI002B4B847C|nr:thioesterase family protein [Nocardia sp.]HLS78460.1 thioesterase family protein [Nocardia sp.]
MSESSEASAYFRRVGPNTFVPTVHTTGAWTADEQHFSPVAGLLVHEIQRLRTAEQRPAMAISRVTFDILGRVPVGEFEVEARVVRPGRTIELVEATAFAGGRAAVTARVWLMVTGDTSTVAGGATEPLPAPETRPRWAMDSLWPGGFIASLDVRSIGEYRPGRAATWVRTEVNLVEGEPTDEVTAFLALVDTANGIASREKPSEWMYPNLDLSIHLHRQPEGRWVGLDTTVVFGGTGQGLTSTVLHDVTGPVGHAQQILTVRPQPGEWPPAR